MWITAVENALIKRFALKLSCRILFITSTLLKVSPHGKVVEKNKNLSTLTTWWCCLLTRKTYKGNQRNFSMFRLEPQIGSSDIDDWQAETFRFHSRSKMHFSSPLRSFASMQSRLMSFIRKWLKVKRKSFLQNSIISLTRRRLDARSGKTFCLTWLTWHSAASQCVLVW